MKRALEGASAVRRLRAARLTDAADLLSFIAERPVVTPPAGNNSSRELDAAVPDFGLLVQLALHADFSLARSEARRLGTAMCETTLPAALQRLQLRVAALPAAAALWLHEEGVFHLGRWIELVIGIVCLLGYEHLPSATRPSGRTIDWNDMSTRLRAFAECSYLVPIASLNTFNFAHAFHALKWVYPPVRILGHAHGGGQGTRGARRRERGR